MTPGHHTVAVIVCAASLAACNPFAPGLDDTLAGPGSLLGDPATLEGVFQNIKYSYTFRDTTILGQLLHPEFQFTFRDYDRGADIAWSRDEEMRITHSLFQNVQQLDLVWNNVLSQTIDSAGVFATVSRNFNLTVTFNASDIIRADGYATMTLVRQEDADAWEVIRWRDDSNF